MHSSVADPPDSTAGAAAPDAGFAEPGSQPLLAAAAGGSEEAAKPSIDALGIALAVICGIHCVATPLLALVPLGSMIFASTFEWLLPAGAVLLAVAVIASDTVNVHGRRAPAAVLGIATLLLATGHCLHGAAGTALAVAGSACLAAALVLNVRLRRRARACSSAASAPPRTPI
jgi:hypothetical protein